MEEMLKRGEYGTFLEYVGALSMGWLTIGDNVFETLLTKMEQKQAVNREAQSELEELVIGYMQHLKESHDTE